MSHRAQSFLILLPFHFSALLHALQYLALERLELKGLLLSRSRAPKQPSVTECSKNIKSQFKLRQILVPINYSNQNISASALSLLESIPCSHINTILSLTAKRAAFFHSIGMNTHELSRDEKQALISAP